VEVVVQVATVTPIDVSIYFNSEKRRPKVQKLRLKCRRARCCQGVGAAHKQVVGSVGIVERSSEERTSDFLSEFQTFDIGVCDRVCDLCQQDKESRKLSIAVKEDW